ncbi:ATP-binding protein [Caballeronia sp. BR00000012568055]|uniref:hybrid sensor histidine kinase/response regulator n=1 Tax=Caballeronia sp. BR00000012568055 TaxID=2918761 RepID=UPI0023F8B657|nr:ATP-binding protein [Caballeronia sp. BR00000012568055]
MIALNHPARLSCLTNLHILDTPVDPHFDALTKLTAHVLRVPRAFVNFVDGARTWCKSAWGAAREIRAHDQSLCAYALENMGESDDVIILDPASQESIQQHPEVTGESKIIFYMAFVLRSPDGFVLGTLCVKDIVAHKPAEHDIAALRLLGAQVTLLLASLLEKQEVADRARRNRDQFLAMLAHELRAPMSPILTAVQILNRSEVTTSQREWAKKLIGRHVRHIGQIVEHLLSTSMVSLGIIKLHLEPVRVVDLLEQAFEMTDAFVEDRHHSLTRTIVGDPVVMADRVQCPLILVNLLSNAAKYTPPHGQIHVSVEGDGERVRIALRDNGVGIEANDLEEIFQIFGQTHRPLDRSAGGLGLGLPFARRLAEWHDGSLEVSSEGAGKGSEFVLWLRQTIETEQREEGHQFVSLEGKLDIVVIDDNVDTADALALYCQMAGHSVRVAYRSEDALDLVRQRIPDVVLSDIGLPEIDGYALVRALRAIAGTASIFSIAITGYASKSDKQLANDAGFDDHFSKPVDLKRLDALLQEIVRKHT